MLIGMPKTSESSSGSDSEASGSRRSSSYSSKSFHSDDKTESKEKKNTQQNKGIVLFVSLHVECMLLSFTKTMIYNHHGCVSFVLAPIKSRMDTFW